MKNVYDGKQYRIFKDTILGYPYYILEDSTKAVQKQGVWYNVKITNHYFNHLFKKKIAILIFFSIKKSLF